MTTTTGSCSCGNVQYEFTTDPLNKIVSGSATANVVVPKDRFHITSGYPKQYSRAHVSGAKVTVHFCSDCSCVLHKELDGDAYRGTLVIPADTLTAWSRPFNAQPRLGMWVN